MIFALLPNYSQVFLARSNNPLLEDGTLHLHVGLVERTHDGLDPVFVDLEKEVLDGLFRSRAGGVGGDRGGRARSGGAGAGARGLMQQEELDVGAGNEAGDVVVEELIDHFEVPIEWRQRALVGKV